MCRNLMRRAVQNTTFSIEISRGQREVGGFIRSDRKTTVPWGVTRSRVPAASKPAR
ncbi:MAG: hypothetical protein WA900_08310 [Casimicrobiaceae bacterium]